MEAYASILRSVDAWDSTDGACLARPVLSGRSGVVEAREHPLGDQLHRPPHLLLRHAGDAEGECDVGGRGLGHLLEMAGQVVGGADDELPAEPDPRGVPELTQRWEGARGQRPGIRDAWGTGHGLVVLDDPAESFLGLVPRLCASGRDVAVDELVEHRLPGMCPAASSAGRYTCSYSGVYPRLMW